MRSSGHGLFFGQHVRMNTVETSGDGVPPCVRIEFPITHLLFDQFHPPVFLAACGGIIRGYGRQVADAGGT